MTSHNDQEPIVGNLVATTEDSESQKIVKQSEDDKDSKTEEQQEIIVLNQEEEEPENEQEQQIIVVDVQPESDQESEEEQQQQKIVVNIQPEEEESESEEEQEPEEEQQQKIVVNQDQGQQNQNQDQQQEENQQQQKITIIEEPIYIPPAEEEPRYSAATATLVSTFTGRTGESNYINKNYRGEGFFTSASNGIFHSFDYWLDDNATNTTFTNVNGGSSSARNLEVGGILENPAFDPSDRGLKLVCEPGGWGCQWKNSYLFPKPNSGGRISAVYSKSNGFSGIYTYEGRTGNITGDVNLDFKYYSRSNNKSVSISGAIKGKEGPQGNSIIMNGDNFGMIAITVSIDPKTGTFNTDDHPYGASPFFAEQRQYDHDPRFRGAFKVNENINSGTVRSVKGSFSNDGAKGTDEAQLPNHIAGEVRMEGFYQGSDSTGSQYNKLVGVFVGDKK